MNFNPDGGARQGTTMVPAGAAIRFSWRNHRGFIYHPLPGESPDLMINKPAINKSASTT
ncbi:hypothetical protein [Rhodovastum atsumiense]|uniref:hypothetical protein n=1 Tax=Rhodovastum atsumiense TaxID=504468 RepID=UPI00139F2BCD|nr:hypothetical protein [Rhodovastum atsumiense]